MSNIADVIVPPTVDLLTAKRNRDDAFNSDVEEDTNATVTPPVHSWTKLIQRVAKDVWGIDKLYPYQIRIIEALISGATPLE
jgi:alpha-beta hydrolase superfamily lysophospholipase